MKKIVFASLAACLLIGSAATSANAMTRAQWWALHHQYATGAYGYGYSAPMMPTMFSPMAVNPYATPAYPVYHRYYHRRIW